MKTLKHYAKLYRLYISQFLKQLMQSKTDMFLGLFGFFTVQISGIYFLYLVFQRIPSIDGWNFGQLLFVYGFAQIPRGLDHLLTDNIWLLAWQLVVNGSFDRYMLRPVGLLFQVISEKIQPDAFGELTVGIVLLVTSIHKGVFHFTAGNTVVFILSVVAGSIIYTSIKLMYASLAFWLKISGPFVFTAYSVAEFGKYPISIYNKVIRFIISWIVPFAFVAYFPAACLLGKEGFMETVGLECVIAVVSALIGLFMFRWGTSRYESSGN